MTQAVTASGSVQEIRRTTHRLDSSRRYNIRFATGDRLGGQRNCLQARSACLVHCKGWDFIWESRSSGYLASWIGTIPGLARMTKNYFIDVWVSGLSESGSKRDGS
jgi:hypothetical protein